MDSELLDVLDCTGEKTGSRIARDDAHAAGIWHGAFHCLIIYVKENRPVALFQKRSAAKKIAPDRFDVSTGGHYSAGEDAATAGPRELFEELGVTVRFEQLVPLGRRVFVYCFTPGVREFEFQDIFLLPLAAMPRDLALQEGEVDALLELDLEEGIRLFSGKVRSTAATGYSKGGEARRQTVTAADFVPCLDNYYLKLLLLARRYACGERDALAI